jgi:hypothetical protein
MVMRKILFGSIVFFSLAFLAACGGGGSGSSGAAGAAGAAGADGATGATGSIAVPTDADLALTASTTADTDESIGQVAKSFTLSGTNSEATDSRLRYYAYLGSSAASKTHAVTAVSAINGVSITGTILNAVTAAWPLDTRSKLAADNYTLALLDGADLGAAANDGSITHLIVCAGNEAGDAASCPTVAIDDMGVSYADAGGTSGDTTADNSTMGAVVATGSANDFQMFHSNSTGAGVIASAITDAKGSAPTSSGASAVHTTTGSPAVLAMAAMGTSDAVYVLVQDNASTDNGTFYSRTATSGNLATATGALNDTMPIQKGAMILPVSSTKAYAVWARGAGLVTDNTTRVYASLLTLSAGTVSASNIGDYVGDLHLDNNSQQANNSLTFGPDSGDALPEDYPICAAARAESVTAGGYAGATTTTQLAVGYADNGTIQGVAPNWNVRFTADSDNFSYRSTVTDVGVNSSMTSAATQNCAMSWAEGLVNTSAATDNGTLYWVGSTSGGNDAEEATLLKATDADNGSAATFAVVGSAVDYSDQIHQLAITYDYLNRPYVAALLDNGSVRLHWSATGGAFAAYNGGIVSNLGDSAKPIALVRSADGKQLALSYHTAATVAAGTDMKVVVIYADGTSN